MVDVISCANAFLQVEEVVDGRNDVGWLNVLKLQRNVTVGYDWHNAVRIILGVNQDLLQLNRCRNNSFIRWRVGNHLEVIIVQGRFQSLQYFFGNYITLVGQDFTSFRISQRFGQRLTQQPILHHQFLVGLVTANWCHIVALWIKEASRQQIPC